MNSLKMGLHWLAHFRTLRQCRRMVFLPLLPLPPDALNQSLPFALISRFSSSLSFLLLFPAHPQAGTEGPKPSLLWLPMHNFKAYF